MVFEIEFLEREINALTMGLEIENPNLFTSGEICVTLKY